jgi:nicotinate-nucleotide adenylyltransferase
MATVGEFMSETCRRIILFGGAFDPPHKGHLRMAKAATEELNPDKLLWIPTAHPAHRKNAQASFKQRCKMIHLIIDNEARWELCTLEDERDKPSYFIDTLNVLIKKEKSADFYVLIGQDQLDNFTQWNSWEKIVAKATLVVMPRNNYKTTSLQNANVIMLKAEKLTISSTQLRQNIDSDDLPDSIRTFIRDKRLYIQAI